MACPGRLGDLIERGSIRLDAVEIVVLDEADRMADMGFLPDVKRLLDLTPSTRQTLLFSATLDGDIDVLVRRYQHDPARHELEVDEDDASAAVHLFWRASSGDRVGVTADIAAAAGPTIVFSRTKHATDRIARQLEQRGVRAAAIHGDRSQKQREKALDLFVRGRSTHWWRPTWPPGGSMSTGSTRSSTSIRRPMPRTTSTGRVGRPVPVPPEWWSRW